jgi:hypothetical protein
MQRIAHQESRRSTPYTDVTVSLAKSVSILHTSIRENERQARLALIVWAVRRIAAGGALWSDRLGACPVRC